MFKFRKGKRAIRLRIFGVAWDALIEERGKEEEGK